MAWKEISFADKATGLPLPGLGVSRTAISRATWSAVLSGISSVGDLGGGAYGVTVDDALVNDGVIILFDGGATAFPRYQLATLATDGLFAVLVTNPDGSLYTGAGAPTVGLYVGSNGIDRTPPTLTKLGDLTGGGENWAWVGEATAGDQAIGVAARFDFPADAIPVYLNGQIAPGSGPIGGTPPVVTVISPTPGATIGKNEPWVVDVTDESGLLREVVLLAKFPDLGIWEVVHDGNDFGPLYPAGRNERVPISLGYRFTMNRRGGWPAGGPATLRAIAIDTTGDEA